MGGGFDIKDIISRHVPEDGGGFEKREGGILKKSGRTEHGGG